MSRSKQEKAVELFREFLKTVAALRDPKTGCPWDLEQNHETLRRWMIEEAYEAVELMKPDASQELAVELGDVLLQVVLNAQIADDDSRFNISDVITSINKKMIRRHPHVFADTKVNSVDDVKTNWERIKSQENTEQANSGIFSKLHRTQPALRQAFEIGKLSKKINFDWERPQQVFDQLKEEVDELQQALQSRNEKEINAELSDVYFTLVQLTRHLKRDPEVVALDGNAKFLKRFEIMETLVAEGGKLIGNCSREELERYWIAAKGQENSASLTK